ncbi:MAG: glycosyltransferase [Candidatus Firestonebacteria bacterium]|nr:glycosyltransferase [Candidatus Firestonebacteria bacterium]
MSAKRKTGEGALPKVSVVIPCYNAGEFLDETVASVLQQTYRNFEIIIVDDGSQDAGTRKLLDHYAREKTKVYRLKKNQGPSAARNFGIEKSTGKYILPLDADDKIAPAYLSKAVKILEKHPDVGIVYCRANFFGNREGEWILPEYSFPDILIDNMIFATAFFRKASWKKAGGFNPNMVHGMEDYDFWLGILEAERCRVHRINEVLFYYRINRDSRTVRLAEKDYNLQMFTQLFYNHVDLFLRDNNIQVLFKNRLALVNEINRLRRLLDSSLTLKIENQLDAHPRVKRYYQKFYRFLFWLYLSVKYRRWYRGQ